MKNSIQISQALPQDIQALYDLMVELAHYERAPEEVETSPAQLLADGFGETPLFRAWMAKSNELPIGFALVYYRYSTWKGKRLYLEDLFVKESFRRSGVGKLLMQTLIDFAVADNCNGITWQVLNWNEPAIRFYEKLNANLDNGWSNGCLTLAQIRMMSNSQNVLDTSKDIRKKL